MGSRREKRPIDIIIIINSQKTWNEMRENSETGLDKFLATGNSENKTKQKKKRKKK